MLGRFMIVHTPRGTTIGRHIADRVAGIENSKPRALFICMDDDGRRRHVTAQIDSVETDLGAHSITFKGRIAGGDKLLRAEWYPVHETGALTKLTPNTSP